MTITVKLGAITNDLNRGTDLYHFPRWEDLTRGSDSDMLTASPVDMITPAWRKARKGWQLVNLRIPPGSSIYLEQKS